VGAELRNCCECQASPASAIAQGMWLTTRSTSTMPDMQTLV
jgi:hypothetical protein